MMQVFNEVQTLIRMNLNPPKTKEKLTPFPTTNATQITPIQINVETVLKCC